MRGRRGPTIVLAQEDDRKIPDHRQVQRLVCRPAIGRAVAEEGETDLAAPSLSDREPDAGCHRQASGHHSVGAQDTDRCIGDVHGTTLPLARAGPLGIQLGHHPRRVGTLRH